MGRDIKGGAFDRVDLGQLIGRVVNLPGHFAGSVRIEDARRLGTGIEVRVRLGTGGLEEAVLTIDDLLEVVETRAETAREAPAANAEQVRLLVESRRIRLAYSYDKYFAVGLSGIRTLPHQVEAVYLKMLPQPRLRFLLADDPGAGKTIMAGLLFKELKLRGALESCLILAPAPLTIQWQDELLRFFGESFQIVNSANDQQQLINLWERESQVIASLDYAKQDNVRERVWMRRWDLVIIDEAHKCSAHTKSSSNRGDEVEKTKRYQLAERLSSNSDHFLLLTATPHHGDEDRFAHFVRLIDPDIFPEPHKVGDEAGKLRREVLKLGPDCPWAIRRLKEDLKDIHGHRLFPDRHTQTISFSLSHDEYQLYKAVTAYINEFLPQTTGRKKSSVALARTVLQRRLASSTRAIHESLARRLKRLDDLLNELESLPPAQRAKRLAVIQGRLVDDEQDEDDLDDTARDELVDTVTGSAQLDQLRIEIAALRDLVGRALQVREAGQDSKLAALQDSLNKAEFRELKDGRGKLLIFTEHRDTLRHLMEHIERWGFSTCEIHGGMNPYERKRAQEAFRTTQQVCVATEAAGEGINLQFCHLMINYDLPWNPTRLEQRLGRIHRIGQTRDVYVLNFVATGSQDGQPVIEGRILERLLLKLDTMRVALGDRVFDVIGEVLSLNAVNLPEMLREAAYEPRRLADYLDQIDRMDDGVLERYEQATGIALAREHVDLASFARASLEAEERRVMPRYVESHFIEAARTIGLRVEPRADGLWRVEHVLADLRSDRLGSVRKFGKADSVYRKLTFYKEHLELDRHLDAVLVGPGQALYAAVEERLQEILSRILGQQAVFVDGRAESPYYLHFFEAEIRGEGIDGKPSILNAELIALRQDLPSRDIQGGNYSVVASDVLVDLPAHPHPPSSVQPLILDAARDFIKASVQMERRIECQADRHRFVQVSREYLERSFEARIRAAQDRIMSLRAREPKEPEVLLARQRSEQELEDLQRSRGYRLEGMQRLLVARHGPIRHVASALVLPPGEDAAEKALSILDDLDPETRRRIELAAEDIVIAYEARRKWECERVGHLKIGFDIRSLAPSDNQTGYRDPVYGVRRIEVKGRKRGQPIRLTTNEWYKAQQLGDSYWLYVVWDPLEDSKADPLVIQNPAKYLDQVKREVFAARYFDLPATAIEEVSRRQLESS